MIQLKFINMKTDCIKCLKSYEAYIGDFSMCFACNQAEIKKIIKRTYRPKIPQTDCTKHLTIEQKKQIAAFIIETHGVLYKNYKDAPSFILEKLGITIDAIGIRSIVNSSYFKEMAFVDCE